MHPNSHPPALFRVLVGVVSVELVGDPFLPITVDGFSGLGGLALNEKRRWMKNTSCTFDIWSTNATESSKCKPYHIPKLLTCYSLHIWIYQKGMCACESVCYGWHLLTLSNLSRDKNITTTFSKIYRITNNKDCNNAIMQSLSTETVILFYWMVRILHNLGDF